MTRYIPGGSTLPGERDVGVAHAVRLDGVQARPEDSDQNRRRRRDRAIAALGDHFAAGRLNAEEFEQRVDQAIQARFNDDLEPLFVDLPRTVEPSVESDRNARQVLTSRGRPWCGSRR